MPRVGDWKKVAHRMKLDRLLAKHDHMGRTTAHRLLATRCVRVDGIIVADSQHEVDRFMLVEAGGQVIQAPQRSLYFMLHKPVGYLSATKDEQHPTVLALIDDPDKETLHIAGRLDRSTSGLVLLTNDGRWSKRVMSSEHEVPKVYWVETSEVIAPNVVDAFAQGFHFHTENITTLPAKLKILGDRSARLMLHEGRYHQVKRMFHRVNNRVVKLHRESIGNIVLGDRAPGAWRALTDEEVASVR
jgi:16S rRNA pseudouridine516 synthase